MFKSKQDDALSKKEIISRSVNIFKTWTETMVNNFYGYDKLLKVHDECVNQIIENFQNDPTLQSTDIRVNKETMVEMYLQNKTLFPRRNEILKV